MLGGELASWRYCQSMEPRQGQLETSRVQNACGLMHNFFPQRTSNICLGEEPTSEWNAKLEQAPAAAVYTCSSGKLDVTTG